MEIFDNSTYCLAILLAISETASVNTFTITSLCICLTNHKYLAWFINIVLSYVWVRCQIFIFFFSCLYLFISLSMIALFGTVTDKSQNRSNECQKGLHQYVGIWRSETKVWIKVKVWILDIALLTWEDSWTAALYNPGSGLTISETSRDKFSTMRSILHIKNVRKAYDYLLRIKMLTVSEEFCLQFPTSPFANPRHATE